MMLRIALFLLIGLGLAGFGTVAWISLRGTATATPTAEAVAVPTKAVILASARSLRAGTLLKPEDIGTVVVAMADMAPGTRPDTQADRGALLGAMVRRSLQANEAILPADVMRPGDHGFLAAVLGAGKRAVSVGVDAISGTAGLIWPGDNVDLILTQTLDDTSLPAGRRVSGETVLHNVRVIAIDQQMMQGAGAGSTDYQPARTVTLEVTPAQAERVQVAVRLGKLSLAVVSADISVGPAGTAPTTVAAGSVTWGGDVSSALKQGPATGGGSTLRVFQGTTDAKEFKF